MRIIHIVPAISGEASGPSYSVKRLCEELAHLGHKVTLVTLDWEPMSSPSPFVKTFPLGFGPRRLGRSPAMLHWLKKQVSLNLVDIIHNHGIWQMNAIYPGKIIKKNDVKLVVSPRGALSEWALRHGSRLKKIFWPFLQRPCYKKASCFHATAELEYKDIRRLDFHQPVAIIPVGIDIPDFKAVKNESFQILLFLSRIHPKKGLDLLLQAWKFIQDYFPEWRLIIAGSDDVYHGPTGYLNELRQMAQNLGLKRIEFIGELLGEEKIKVYQQADLFILPTYSENFGIVVAEALASGVPVITTKGAPWHGLITHGAGWWIDIGLEPLVACLKDALAAPREKLIQMGISGRNWMINEYSWNRIGKMMEETYKWILHRHTDIPDWVKSD